MLTGGPGLCISSFTALPLQLQAYVHVFWSPDTLLMPCRSWRVCLWQPMMRAALERPMPRRSSFRACACPTPPGPAPKSASRWGCALPVLHQCPPCSATPSADPAPLRVAPPCSCNPPTIGCRLLRRGPRALAPVTLLRARPTLLRRVLSARFRVLQAAPSFACEGTRQACAKAQASASRSKWVVLWRSLVCRLTLMAHSSGTPNMPRHDVAMP